MKRIRWVAIFLFLLLLGACQTGAEVSEKTSQISQVSPTATFTPSPRPTGGAESTPDATPADAVCGLTYQREDGNRWVGGKGNLPAGSPARVSLSGEGRWLVAVPYKNGSLWTVVLADGSVETFYHHLGQAERVDLGWGPLPPGSPPLLIVSVGEPRLVPPPDTASPLTHPLVLDARNNRLVFIDQDGDLVLWQDGEEVDRLAVDALPDARLIKDEAGRLLFLSSPTERYGHGVLGDALEAGAISLVETEPALRLVNRITIPDPAVVEGIAPLWVDLDGEGAREILVTVSDPRAGARLVLYSEEGERLAEGPAAGQGFRWRHQLVALPLGSGGERVIVDVLRPHLDATLELFTWQGEKLILQDSLAGYPSHTIGSRNLDMALAGDLDGDGAPEILVPGPERRTLQGIGVLEGEAVEKWSVDLGGRLTGNLSGVSLPGGKLAFGAVVGETLLLWGR